MLQLHSGSTGRNCQGQTRRAALKAGLLGVTGLSLADVLKLRAEGRAKPTNKSVILIWLDGGLSQLESYDPKPESPVEYRGPFGVTATNVPGVTISDILPEHAKRADKLAFVRSVHHGTGDHFAAAHWMLTGRFGSTAVSLPQKFPSVGSFISRVKGTNEPGLPAYVGLPAAESVYLFPGYQGAAYLGAAYNPFDFDSQYKYLHFSSANPTAKPTCLENFATDEEVRTSERATLLQALDQIDRKTDHRRQIDTLDRYQQEALGMILSGKAKRAFDLSHEHPMLIGKYGDNPWGRYTLMARRLVEAGVTFVTVDMPHWDDHSNIKVGHGGKLEVVDRAVGALIDDLSWSGLLDEVLVVVMSEFGRTPRINNGQPGIAIPGRDHWGDAISVMMAGGGLRGGLTVGRTNARAEHPVDRALKPHDVLATIYRVMGVDWTQTFNDFAGRPMPILPEGEAIRELF